MDGDGDAAIFSRVAELAAAEGNVVVGRVTLETHFVNDLNFDSLTTVEFVMRVEDEFGVTVPEDAARELHTVGQVVDYLTEHIAGGEESTS